MKTLYYKLSAEMVNKKMKISIFFFQNLNFFRLWNQNMFCNQYNYLILKIYSFKLFCSLFRRLKCKLKTTEYFPYCFATISLYWSYFRELTIKALLNLNFFYAKVTPILQQNTWQWIDTAHTHKHTNTHTHTYTQAHAHA